LLPFTLRRRKRVRRWGDEECVLGVVFLGGRGKGNDIVGADKRCFGSGGFPVQADFVLALDLGKDFGDGEGFAGLSE
jgi:hypothetical protein